MSRPRLLGFALALTALGALVTRSKMSARSGTPRFDPAPATAPAARRMVGLNVHGTQGELLPEDVAMLQALGVTRVRYTLLWRNYAGDPTYRAMIDAGIARARAAGLELLIVVHTTPLEYEGTSNFAAGISALASFVAARAAQYPSTAWQILNEMDGVGDWNGHWFYASHTLPSDSDQTTNGVRYAQMIGPVYDAVLAADPTARVVTGGIAHQPLPFYQGIASAGAAAKMHAFALHAYGVPNTQQFAQKSAAMRAVLGTTPLWITEFGTQHADDATQATGVAAVLDDNDRNARYDRAYLYALYTDTAAGDYYGVVRRGPGGAYQRRHAAMLLVDRPSP